MLKLSADRKISPLSKWKTYKDGVRAEPLVKNGFGLPAGDSCPGLTEFCQSCYACKSEKMYPNVNKLVWYNFELLQQCGSNVTKMVDLLDEMVKSVNWHGQNKVFRWHWDGDIFSKAYAIAIAETAKLNPDVQFWLYTRSFDWVAQIVDVPNLVVYLSVDKFNQKKAKNVLKKFPQVLVAACGDTWAESEEIMRATVGRDAPKCPELTGRYPLVSEDGIGACVQCDMCIYGKNHVKFAVKRPKIIK